MNKSYIYILSLLALVICSCEPEAKWTDRQVEVNMNLKKVSAAFIECDFSTNKDTYYMVAIERAREGYDPMAHQKQFMLLALDSANVEYLSWRNKLLRQGEFHVAPFSSHALQYGNTNHFFTGLYSDTEYWVYAFAVNPETLEPISLLTLTTIRTKEKSTEDILFDYRVKGYWDYIYPVNTQGNITSRFPYVATTRDSLEIANDSLLPDPDPINYFVFLLLDQFTYPERAKVYYGVHAVENNSIDSHLIFEEGHTYYTAIGGFDGNFRQAAIYKFKWKDGIEIYFHDNDTTNLLKMVPKEERWWDIYL